MHGCAGDGPTAKAKNLDIQALHENIKDGPTAKALEESEILKLGATKGDGLNTLKNTRFTASRKLAYLRNHGLTSRG